MITYTLEDLAQCFDASQESVGFVDPHTLDAIYCNHPFAQHLEVIHMHSGRNPLYAWPALQHAMQTCLRTRQLSICADPEWHSHWEVLPVTLVQRDGSTRAALQCKVFALNATAEVHNQHYQQVLEGAPINMWACTPKGEVFWINETSNLYRHGRKQVHDLTHNQYVHNIHPDDLQSTSAQFGTGMARGKVEPFRYRLRHHEGAYQWFQFMASPVRGPDGHIRYWSGCSVNIEHFVQAEAAQQRTIDAQAALIHTLRQQLAEAQSLLASTQHMDLVTHLAGGVAHDLNNMLFVMRMHIGNLERKLTDASLLASVHATHECIRKAARLSNQLSGFSGRLPQNNQPLQPAAVLEEAHSLFQQAVGAEVDFRTHIAKDLPCVMADRTYLENALINLLINARDAVDRRGQVQLHVSSALEQQPPCVRFSVSDNGCGISAEVQAKIFTPFFTTKEVGKGTGLGLAMVKNFVESSGGTLHVASTLGQGTTFTFELPITTQTMAVPEPLSTEAHHHAPGGSVMLIEDDDDVRQLMSSCLVELGYQLIIATNPDKALVLLERGVRPDVIFSDLRMPGKKTVADLIAYVEALAQPIPMVFATGYSADVVIEEGLLQGRYPVLFKPFAIEAMAHKLQEVMATRAPGGTATAPTHAYL